MMNSKYIAKNRITHTTRGGKEIDITLFTGQTFKIPAPRFYVMYNGKKNMAREAAVDAALDEAIKLNLLEGFFRIHRAEVKMVSILEEEFDIKSYAEDIRYIAAHDANVATARNLLNMGLTPEQIAEGTGLPLSEITALQA